MLLMYGTEKEYQEAYNKDYQNTTGLIEVLEASGNLFTIEGSSHMKFTDIGLFIGVPLKGKTSHSLDSLVEKYPELKKS